MRSNQYPSIYYLICLLEGPSIQADPDPATATTHPEPSSSSQVCPTTAGKGKLTNCIMCEIADIQYVSIW